MASATLLWLDFDEKRPRFAFANMIAVDGFTVFFYVLIAVSVVLAALVAESYLEREGLDGPEFYVLTMLSAAGTTPLVWFTVAAILVTLAVGAAAFCCLGFALTAAPETLAISNDAAATTTNLQKFVDAYNAVVDTTRTHLGQQAAHCPYHPQDSDRRQEGNLRVRGLGRRARLIVEAVHEHVLRVVGVHDAHVRGERRAADLELS